MQKPVWKQASSSAPNSRDRAEFPSPALTALRATEPLQASTLLQTRGSSGPLVAPFQTGMMAAKIFHVKVPVTRSSSLVAKRSGHSGQVPPRVLTNVSHATTATPGVPMETSSEPTLLTPVGGPCPARRPSTHWDTSTSGGEVCLQVRVLSPSLVPVPES